MIRETFALGTKLLCGCHARWTEPLPDARPRLFFANHTSHLDSVVVWASLPFPVRRRCRFLAAKDFWGRSASRRWLACSVFGAVLIDRTKVTKRNNPLTVMQECVAAGDSLVLFPEGTRGSGEDVAPFRPGLYHAARAMPEVDLVPVWIENLSRVLPKGEILPIPMLVAVTYGPPLRLGDGEAKDDFLTRARQAVLDLRRDQA